MTYRFSARALSLLHGPYFVYADALQNLLREIAVMSEADFVTKYGSSGSIALKLGKSNIDVLFTAQGSIIYVSDIREVR